MTMTLIRRSAVMEAAAAALTDQWATHTQVWQRAGCWARGSIREALIEIYRRGGCERLKVRCPWGFRYEYRRLQCAAAPRAEQVAA